VQRDSGDFLIKISAYLREEEHILLFMHYSNAPLFACTKWSSFDSTATNNCIKEVCPKKFPPSIIIFKYTAVHVPYGVLSAYATSVFFVDNQFVYKKTIYFILLLTELLTFTPRKFKQ